MERTERLILIGDSDTGKTHLLTGLYVAACRQKRRVRFINSLSHLKTLRVVPRTTAFQYKRKSLDPIQVGRELRARLVLTGHLGRRGDRLLWFPKSSSCGKFGRAHSSLTMSSSAAFPSCEKRLVTMPIAQLSSKRCQSAVIGSCYRWCLLHAELAQRAVCGLSLSTLLLCFHSKMPA